MRYLQAPGVVPRQFFLEGPLAHELSIFADESSDRGGSSKYYLLTLVFHDQSKSILDAVGVYENSLREGNLPNIPFHSEPLLNGHGDYENLDIAARKKLLISFGAMVRHLPPILMSPLLAQRPRFFTCRREYGIKGVNGAEGVFPSLRSGLCR